MIAINLVGAFEAAQLAVNELKEANKGTQRENSNYILGGVIINNASVAGLTFHPLNPIYAATKAALISYTDSLRGLHKVNGIRVVAICPSFTDTPLLRIPEEQVGKQFSPTHTAR